MAGDEERLRALAALLIDEGYLDDETDALLAAARILQVAKARQASEEPEAREA